MSMHGWDEQLYYMAKDLKTEAGSLRSDDPVEKLIDLRKSARDFQRWITKAIADVKRVEKKEKGA